MRVVVDTLPNERGGGITYLKNILPRLGGTEDQYYILVPEGRDALDRSQPMNVELVDVRFPINNLLLRFFYQQFVLPFVLLSLDADVLYSPADITIFFAPCPTAVAVRNPNPYFEQPNHTVGERLRYRVQRLLSRLSALRSTAVIFVSEHSRERMNKYLHVRQDKCHVIYHGIDRELFQDPMHPGCDDLVTTVEEAEPFILCISTIYKHKNYEELIRGYASLPMGVREEYPLVIAGGYADNDYYKSILELTRSEGIEDNVVFLGKVDYEFVPYLYTSAAVSVLPSKLETFGHTLVESMAAGVPIIAADSTCIPEITDGAALLFNPDDHGTLVAHLENVLTNDEIANQLVSDGNRRVQHFSWERTARETHNTLRTIAGE